MLAIGLGRSAARVTHGLLDRAYLPDVVKMVAANIKSP